MTNIDPLIEALEDAEVAVEAGVKNADCCCTLVAPTMKGTGIRPEMVAMKENGDRIYLLNIKQVRKLLARAREAREAI